MPRPPQQPAPGGRDDRRGGDAPEQQQPAWYGNQYADQTPEAARPTARPSQPDAPFLQQPFPQEFPQPEPPAAERAEPDFLRDEPSGRRSRLPWVLGTVAALAIAGCAAVALVHGTSTPDAHPAARDLLGKVNAHDFAGLDAHLCQPNAATLHDQLGQLSAGRFALELGAVTAHGEGAEAEITGTYTMGGTVLPVRQKLQLALENGDWKLCALG